MKFLNSIVSSIIILIFSIVSSQKALAEISELQLTASRYNSALAINQNKVIELLSDSESKKFLTTKMKEIKGQSLPEIKEKDGAIVFSVKGIDFHLKPEDLKSGKFSLNGQSFGLIQTNTAEENFSTIVEAINRATQQTTSFNFSSLIINEAHAYMFELAVAAIVLFVVAKMMMTPYKMETVELNPRIEEVTFDCVTARNELQVLKNSQPEAIRNYLATHKKLIDQNSATFGKQISPKCVSTGKGVKNTQAQCLKSFKEGEQCYNDIKRINAELEATYSGMSNDSRNKVIKKPITPINKTLPKNGTIGR